MTNLKYKDICAECLPVVRKVGEWIRTELGRVKRDHVEVKGLNSLVTYVDKEAELKLVAGLSKILPSAGFITEEDTVTQGGSELLWIVDPLDGTNNFLQGIPHFAISVGLMSEGELVVGLVFEINHQEMYYAWKGGGAFLNGQIISVSREPSLSETVLATGFPYLANNVNGIVQSLEYFMKNARGIRRFGAAALDLAYVACGRFDAYYESSLNAWDMAGGALIVREAGGVVTDFASEMGFLEKGEVIASNGLIHNQIAEIVYPRFYS